MDTTDAQLEKDGDAHDDQTRAARVIGLDEAEENIIFQADGKRFSVPVDGELRRLIRRARSTPVAAAPAAEEEAVAPSAELTPREIQARMRAGESAEDIAATSDFDVEAIRRYESPILAERAYVIEQAQAAPISRDPEAPVLGEVTVDRLAARGVDSNDLEWSAYRLPGSDWTVELQFTAGERDRSATWSFEPRSRLVTALDDESRWLTESDEPRDEPIPTRLTPVRDWVYDVDTDGGVVGAGSSPSSDADAVETQQAGADEKPDVGDFMAHQQDLLDELSSRRGRRQPLLGEDDDDPFDILGDIPAAHPPASRPDLATDAEILQLPESSEPDESAEEVAEQIGDVEAIEEAPDKPDVGSSEKRTNAAEGGKGEGAGTEEKKKPRPSRRSARRASVPSWDEIVFGARTD